MMMPNLPKEFGPLSSSTTTGGGDHDDEKNDGLERPNRIPVRNQPNRTRFQLPVAQTYDDWTEIRHTGQDDGVRLHTLKHC